MSFPSKPTAKGRPCDPAARAKQIVAERTAKVKKVVASTAAKKSKLQGKQPAKLPPWLMKPGRKP